MYPGTNKLTHICALHIWPQNTTLAAFRQPYFINPFSVDIAKTCKNTSTLVVVNNHFQPFVVNQKAEIWLMWPTVESFLQTHLASIKCIQWAIFHIMVRNHQLQFLSATRRPKIGQRAQKSETHLTNVYTMYEVDSVFQIMVENP